MKRTTSPYIALRNSSIHGTGVFAKKNIAKGTRVIEYVGDKITKTESDRRWAASLERAERDSNRGIVYIFGLNKRYDLDGDVPYNTAMYINHSCNPNCEAWLMRGHIWIIAKRDIQKGEEVTYNYGYDMNDYHSHPCRCGSHNCVGYILAEEHWHKFTKSKKKGAPKKNRRAK